MENVKRRGRPPKYRDHGPYVISQQEIDSVADWADFAAYVRENGEWIVKAQYPGRVDVIDTIWRGVPVLDGEMGVMDANSVWHKVQNGK